MRKSEKIIVSNQIECLQCGDRPFSAYVHDFKWCHCGAVAVDGGVDYLRRCGNVEDYKDLSIVEDKLCIQRIVNQAEEMQRTGRNIRGIVYGVLRKLRDEGLLKGHIDLTPKSEVLPITDERLQKCLESLTEIQYFYECSHKHRAWAWDALNALSPELAQLSSDNVKAAFDRVHGAES